MRWRILIPALLFSASALGQADTAEIITLSRETVLSEVVIRSDLDVPRFLRRVKEDTTFYKAFRNLRVLQFTALNDIRMLDRRGRTEASLQSRTRQRRSGGCRTMEVLEERITGRMRKGKEWNYTTAELYASLFFTEGSVCGETNIVRGTVRNVRGASGLEKHKEQLKMMFFNPGQRIPGIPFIGDKIDIFDPKVSRLYRFSIDLENYDGRPCYLFRILPREDLSASERSNIVFDEITTWFDARTMEIVGRNYGLSYRTPVYDFDVSMEVQLGRFDGLLVPRVLRYRGNWDVALKKRERALFTATLFDFSK